MRLLLAISRHLEPARRNHTGGRRGGLVGRGNIRWQDVAAPLAASSLFARRRKVHGWVEPASFTRGAEYEIVVGSSDGSGEAGQENRGFGRRGAREKRRCAADTLLEASIDRQVKETKHSADETRGAVSTWSEIKASLEHQVAAMRADYGDCAHLVERNPDKAARDAEQDAAAAITLASYCLDAAEWAVVRAELVRAAGHAGPRGGTGITAMEAAKLFSRRRCVFQGSSLHPTAAAQAER